MTIPASHAFISVIVPVYNSVGFLAAAVESIRQQRYQPLEILVVDDGSTDGSYELAQTLEDVRCLRQPNGGAARARNAGIKEARGQVLAFLDADDLWTPNKLAAQLAVMHQDPQVHLVAGRVEEFGDEERPAAPRRLQRRSGDRAYTIGALLVRRDDFCRVGLLNEKLRFGEFIDWRSLALACGLKELMLQTVVLRRRLHDHNTTLCATDSRRDYLATVKAHLERKRSARPTSLSQEHMDEAAETHDAG